jgi:mgtE-like transporter
VPSRPARQDLWLVAGLSVPVFVANGAGAHLVAALLGEESPGLGHLVGASLLGGLAAMLVVLAIAYYGTIATVRLGIDPDTYGIPMVSSTVDLVGALTLIIAIASLGLT